VISRNGSNIYVKEIGWKIWIITILLLLSIISRELLIVNKNYEHVYIDISNCFIIFSIIDSRLIFYSYY